MSGWIATEKKEQIVAPSGAALRRADHEAVDTER